MAQGRSTTTISMIEWIRTGRLSIKNYLSNGGAASRQVETAGRAFARALALCLIQGAPPLRTTPARLAVYFLVIGFSYLHLILVFHLKSQKKIEFHTIVACTRTSPAGQAPHRGQTACTFVSPPTRWSTTLSSKVNMLLAIDLRASCGANLVT